MDQVLNVGFFVIHTLWIGFNCVGWLSRRTRRWHLVTLCLTACSWFGLGFWYGWGYCPCTDWHWQVRERLGYQDPDSYTQLLCREVIGADLPRTQADALTLAVFVVATILNVTLSLWDRWRLSSCAG